ncbi:hypothetical protein MMC21_007270 [Puttea exsequens]|nr:hypothetical protein [Puttea exsequens]
MEPPKEQATTREYTLPEWETSTRHSGFTQPPPPHPSLKDRAMEKFERTMPAHRRYYGLSRKIACFVLLAIILALLILIIGLAAGLSSHSNHHRKLPLGSQTYTGDLTYYGPGLGACGVTSSSGDDIVSVSHFLFDSVSTGSDPNANPLCGHKIRAVRGGTSADLTVVDRCTGCEPTDLDVSPGVFRQLADPALGRVTVTWAWLPPIPET